MFFRGLLERDSGASSSRVSRPRSGPPELEQIFAFVPDIRVEVVRSAVDGDAVWTEWEMGGTRRDGKPHRMCGVIVFGVGEDTIRWARFYLEPVDESGATADDAIREQVVRQ